MNRYAAAIGSIGGVVCRQTARADALPPNMPTLRAASAAATRARAPKATPNRVLVRMELLVRPFHTDTLCVNGCSASSVNNLTRPAALVFRRFIERLDRP